MGKQGRHALVIGIDEYPHFPKENQLKTCVADAKLMADLLEDHFGFPAGAIRLLCNDQATREGICDAMEELIDRTGDGDVVVIHYSGHGSQRKEREGERHDEGDGYDETIVPHDSGRRSFPKPHENRDVFDDEIHDWLLRVNAKTPHVTLIFDSCHAGTITRHPSVGIRRVPRDESPRDAGEPAPPARTTRGGGRFGDRHALIAACREDENAHEFPEVGFGALTYFVYQELLRARPGDTYRDLFERFAPQVMGVFRDQRPQLEGTWDREILGLRDFKPMRYVTVESRSGREVVLGGGKAHGLAAESEWSIYPAGTRETEAPPCGKVRLTAVDAVTSRAEILEESTPHVEAGSRAMAISHLHSEVQWKVEVRGAPAAALRAALERALEESPLVALAEPNRRGDARIHFLTPRGGVEEVPQLCGVDAATWAAVEQSGALLLPPLPETAGHVGELVKGLGRWCRYDHVRKLRNTDPGSVLEGKVAVELLRRRHGSPWQPIAPGETVEEGDGLAIKVTNGHDAPIYVSVLDLGLTGAISQVHPVAGAHESLAAGGTLEIGTLEGDEIDVFLPEGFPYGPEDRAGEELVKVFATARQADFRWLTQESAAQRSSAHPLERLLRRTLHGARRGDTRRVATDDWTTVERSFLVRRKGS